MAETGNIHPQNAYIVEPGRAEHIPLLAAIELAAAEIFPPGSVPDSVYTEATPMHYFAEALPAGRFWVAAHINGGSRTLVGYALLRMLSGAPGPLALLAQIDVHPAHGRRGLGRALVREAARRASAEGHEHLYLTTFKNIPWNAPFYARLGFVELDAKIMPEPIRSILDEEATFGFQNRVAMALDLAAPDFPSVMRSVSIPTKS